MRNKIMTDEKKEIRRQEKEAAEAEKQTKEVLKEQLKAEAKAELEAEGLKATKEAIAKRTAMIKKIQEKKFKTSDEKMLLDREMKIRAKENASLPRNLDALLPSQMSKDEMVGYCESKGVEVKKGDSTVMLRARIKAHRNPNQEERLRMLENRSLEGRIV